MSSRMPDRSSPETSNPSASSSTASAAAADAADSMDGNAANNPTTTSTPTATDVQFRTFNTVASTQTAPNPASNPQLVIPSGSSSVSQSNLSTPSTSVIPSTVSSHDLSSKAAAGIGIGAAAAGAAVALFLAFVIFRCCRQRRNTQRLHHESAIALTGTQSQLFHPVYASAPVAPVSLEKTSVSTSTDDALSASWADLGDSIRSHVDSMYHSNPVESGAVSLESFGRLGYARAQPSSPELLDRLMQPNYRPDALTYLVSWCIVQRIDFHGSRQTTLLPPECVDSLKAMAGGATAGKAQCRFTRAKCH